MRLHVLVSSEQFVHRNQHRKFYHGLNLIAESEPPQSKDSCHSGKSPLAHDALCLTMHISVVYNAAANVT